MTNTESFCISCHEMRENVYQDYRRSGHYSNSTGVRATCPDCHVPREWVHKVVRKVRATNELYHKFAGTIDTKKKFNQRRHRLAKTVWVDMQATDSRECRNCHGFEFMSLQSQSAMARNVHELSIRWGKTCIDCHKGLVHTLPKQFDAQAEIDEQHERIERENIECSRCHQDMSRAPPGDGWGGE